MFALCSYHNAILQGNLTLDLSSSRIQMGALGHTLMPFCSVCRQFFGFIPGNVHVLQISSDDFHPIFPSASRLSLAASQFPLCSLTRYSGVIHSAYIWIIVASRTVFATAQLCNVVFNMSSAHYDAANACSVYYIARWSGGCICWGSGSSPIVKWVNHKWSAKIDVGDRLSKRCIVY